jgi:hypothetical protein
VTAGVVDQVLEAPVVEPRSGQHVSRLPARVDGIR